MEFFVVLICCAIAAALGFFIGAMVRTSSLVTLTVENRKLRERIKSEVQLSMIRNGDLRDGTEITSDWSDSVVTIDRGEP